MRRSIVSMTEWSGWLRYALLNLCSILCILAALPYVIFSTYDVAELASRNTGPRAPNLVEKRQAVASKPAPNVGQVASFAITLQQDMPLSDAGALNEPVSLTASDIVPLAEALDAAESIPVNPIRPLHKPRFQALYAELVNQRQETRQAMAQLSDQRRAGRTQRAVKIRRLAKLAMNSEPNLNAGTISLRNFSNSQVAYIP